jgi:hypothetical protein
MNAEWMRVAFENMEHVPKECGIRAEFTLISVILYLYGRRNYS